MSYNQLTMVQRYQIEALRRERVSLSAIANSLGVHHATLCLNSLTISKTLNSLLASSYGAILTTLLSPPFTAILIKRKEMFSKKISDYLNVLPLFMKNQFAAKLPEKFIQVWFPLLFLLEEMWKLVTIIPGKNAETWSYLVHYSLSQRFTTG